MSKIGGPATPTTPHQLSLAPGMVLATRALVYAHMHATRKHPIAFVNAETSNPDMKGMYSLGGSRTAFVRIKIVSIRK